MSVLSQFIGGDSVLIGQTIPMKGALPYFTNNNQEYLKAGFAKAYTASYSTFKSRLPANCFNSLNRIDGTPGNGTSLTNQFARIYHNGTAYVAVQSGASPGQFTLKTSTDLSTWTNNVAFSDYSSFTLYDSCMAGTTTMICGLDTGSTPANACVQWRTAAGTYGNTTVFARQSAVSIDASSTLIVAIDVVSNTATSGILTGTLSGSTPGTFTLRTGTGGGSFTMGTVFWSPVSNAFFIVSAASTSTGISMSKTTDGFTQTSVWANDSGFYFVQNGKDYIAHNSSYTAISGRGKIRYTSNGTSWTTVDLTTLNVGYNLSATAQYRIYYNATTAKFYLELESQGASKYSTYLSTTDFVNWNTEFALRNLTDVVGSAYGIFGVNSKSLSFTQSGDNASGTITGIYDVTTHLASSTPEYVNTFSQTFSTNIDGYVRIA